MKRTSTLIRIFRDMRPIESLLDSRLKELEEVQAWFENWYYSPEVLREGNIPFLINRTNHELYILSYFKDFIDPS